MKDDFYEILGVAKTATDEEIKKKYRSLAMKFHPDRNIDNKSEAEINFKKVKEAYEVLSDSDKRRTYDQYGHDGLDPNRQHNPFGGGFPFGADMFNSFFHGNFNDNGFGGRSQQKGEDVRYKLDITLEEAFFGVTKDVNVPLNVTCGHCNGSGAKRGSTPITCITCHGHGQVIMDQGFFKIQQDCPTCGGQGKIGDPCLECNGHGVTKQFRSVKINVPAGVNTNDVLTVSGKGCDGKGGIPPGDLQVQIDVKPHKIFQRLSGNNLLITVPINFELACLGGLLDVPTIDGSVTIKIPVETQTGTKFKIAGKGMKNISNGNFGDIICTVIIETPKGLTEEQKEILKSLKL